MQSPLLAGLIQKSWELSNRPCFLADGVQALDHKNLEEDLPNIMEDCGLPDQNFASV